MFAIKIIKVQIFDPGIDINRINGPIYSNGNHRWSTAASDFPVHYVNSSDNFHPTSMQIFMHTLPILAERGLASHLNNYSYHTLP